MSEWKSIFGGALLLLFQAVAAVMLACLVFSFFVRAENLGPGRLCLTPYDPNHHCFFCGMTRGFCSVSRGQAAAALGYNRNVLWVYPLFCAQVLAGVCLAGRTKRLFMDLFRTGGTCGTG